MDLYLVALLHLVVVLALLAVVGRVVYDLATKRKP